ncbi:hypothetical protein [Catenulispora subtropica]|uniref:MoxR-vWA-beta-propeller ternary system domain-containing protein n=1 Tax=Catenulispora subtropica TaxID=450798 RepID=A0ABP5CWM4_9ACTN
MTISEIRRPPGGRPDDHAVESWHRREPPLPAVAVLGVGAVATALAAATHLSLADGAALRTVADPEYLVVLGDEGALPWVDGARYLGWDGAALTLTTHRVLPSADLWRATALAAEGADPASLVIVLPEQVLIAANAIMDADPEALAGLFAA